MPYRGELSELPARLRLTAAGAPARVLGPRTNARAAGSALLEDLAPGTYCVHFAPGSRGKPASICVELPPGAFADVAAEPGGGQDAEGGVELEDGGEGAPGAPWTALARSAGEAGPQRVTALCDAAFGPCSLLLRWTGEADHYRFRWEPRLRESVLERVVGGQVLVLGRAAAPGEGTHRLMAQADGFRIACWLDDAPAVLTMDGAHASGRAGVRVERGRPGALNVQIGAPVKPLASIAAVRSERDGAVTAQMIASAPDLAGLDYAVALHARPPRAELGLLPLLDGNTRLLPVGESIRGRWRSVRGSFGPSGRAEAVLSWPARFGALALDAVAQVVAIRPDGSEVVETLPFVSMRL
ncbi:MAG: hypothetical protein Fur0037_06840 [Planctomycetota bacterium]